jgi:hypothetical protein
MKKQVILASLLAGMLFFTPAKMAAQYPNCPNLGFDYGDLTNWQCYAGSCAGGNYSIAPTVQIPGKIDIMSRATIPFYDEKCPVIPKVPDGYSFSCRIGNAIGSNEVDGIEYTMTVDSNNSLLILTFALVLQVYQNPNQNPQFTMKITDTSGNVLPIPCANVNFLPNMMTEITCGINALIAKNWTTVGLDLTPCIGQKIKIYFETRDGTLGSSYGYAYVVGECRPMKIDLQYCANINAARMSAPEGFQEYTWTRSSDTTWIKYTRQVNVPNPTDDEIFTCTLKSELGCEVELKTVITKTIIDADFLFGVKEGNGHVDFAAHGNQSWYDTCTRTVTFVDKSQVRNAKKESILWEIHGLNARSRDSLWTYTFPDPDIPTTYLVRLTVWSENGCADTFSQSITIYPSPKVRIDGPAEFCEGKTVCLKPKAIVSKFILHTWSWKKSSDGSTGLCVCDSLSISEHGIYYLKSLDTTGCYAYDTLIVTPLKPEIQSLSITHIRCKGDGATGSFYFNGIGGGAYPYQEARLTIWDNDSGKYRDVDILPLLGQTIIFRNQIAGDYHFYCMDDDGCELRATITIQEPDTLYFSATTQETTCSEDNGKITFQVNGGVPPYNVSAEDINTHLIKTPANKTKDTVTNLPAGTYIAKVVDNNNCTTFDTIVVSSAPIIPLTSISLSENNMNIPYLNQSKMLSVTLNPPDVCNQDVIWQSRDASIAAVNAYGSVKGISYGETYIVVSSIKWAEVRDSCKVIVGGTGIVGANGIRPIQVYPNPANSELKITNYEGGEIQIFSIMGQTLMTLRTLETIETLGLHETTIDISHLASGMYFLKVGNKVGRFVKE